MDMTQQENDKWFFEINRRLLKLTYENGSLIEVADLLEKRNKLKQPENLLKRITFDPNMKIDYKNPLPHWWTIRYKQSQKNVE